MNDAFVEAMKSGYALDEPAIVIGSPMHEGELANGTRVQVALSMMNRHGLVAGATGTGKTKTLQLLAGQLSKEGVPVFVLDVGQLEAGDDTARVGRQVQHVLDVEFWLAEELAGPLGLELHHLAE